jgi:hypothetical protein
MQLAFQIFWNFFLNRATSKRCCPSVQTVALLLYAISIIRTERPDSVDWRPDGWTSSAWLALSRIASGRLQLSSHFYVWKGNPFTCQTLKGVWTCCRDIQTDATWNSLKLLETDGSLDGKFLSSGRMLLDWRVSGRNTTSSGRMQGIWTSLSWILHRVFLKHITKV